MYITFSDYYNLTDSKLTDERLFDSLCFEACRVMDIHTTGIDNVKKLKRFFPTDEDNAEAVKRCAAKLVNTLYEIHEAEMAAAMSRNYTQTDQGLRRQIISRVEAGNEAITYSETKTGNTMIDAAAADMTERKKLLAGIVWDYLRGVDDANGVNLLYMGMYPRRYLC